MSKKHGYTINDIIDAAAKYYGGDPPQDERRDALNKQIRNGLRAMGVSRGGRKSYLVSAQDVRVLIEGEMRPYLTKFFARKEFDPGTVENVERAKDTKRQAKANLVQQRDAVLSFDPIQEYEELERWEREHLYDSAFEIPNERFESMAIKALMKQVFPEFDEGAFRYDFALRESLQQDLALPSENAPENPYEVQAAMRYIDLSSKLDRAIEEGDLQAYLRRAKDTGGRNLSQRTTARTTRTF